MMQMATDQRHLQTHVIKGRCAFACLQEAVTAHDDLHPPVLDD